ncbi:hypothetical protein REPUB_Repub09cG0030700 [Reevesia pubescens]
MKLKTLHFFLLFIMFLSFMLLVFTPEARQLAPNHLNHDSVNTNPSQLWKGGVQLDEVLEVLDLLGMKDSSGPSQGGGGH